MKYKVMIVDDHIYIREGLKLILESNDLFEVIAQAEDGFAALELLTIGAVKPDVILLDLNMPRLSGLETLQNLNKLGLTIPVVILTTYNENDLMLEGLKLGAHGYLMKDTGREILFRTLESAVRGETLLQPEILTRIIEAKQNIEPPESSRTAPTLSYKEHAVLRAIARGIRSKDVARELGISERTVKTYLTSLYNKLGVANRAQAVAVASELGLI